MLSSPSQKTRVEKTALITRGSLRAAISSRDARAQNFARVFLRHSVTFCAARFPADDRAPWVKHDRGEDRADPDGSGQLL
ncbi:hypothetical protein QRQ56_29015 [Bradyrhizobium sp. U531]|uniref:hypothetical protein n=1 Tax=Bradyrhizobium sp. U531 TaxID=3053458 RepID=UPI003F4322FB